MIYRVDKRVCEDFLEATVHAHQKSEIIEEVLDDLTTVNYAWQYGSESFFWMRLTEIAKLINIDDYKWPRNSMLIKMHIMDYCKWLAENHETYSHAWEIIAAIIAFMQGYNGYYNLLNFKDSENYERQIPIGMTGCEQVIYLMKGNLS